MTESRRTSCLLLPSQGDSASGEAPNPASMNFGDHTTPTAEPVELVATALDWLPAPVLFLHAQSCGAHEAAEHVYTFYTAEGAAWAVARVASFPAPIDLVSAHNPEVVLLRLKPRPLFELKGKFDVVAPETGIRVGILHRRGAIFDGAEERLGSIRAEGSPAQPVGAEASHSWVARRPAVPTRPKRRASGHLRIRLQGREMALVSRERLPFDLTATGEDGRWLWGKHLPGRIGLWLRTLAAPMGWRLELFSDRLSADDARLVIAATLLRSELDRALHRATWSRQSRV